MAQSDLGHSSFNRWISLGEGDPDSGARWMLPLLGSTAHFTWKLTEGFSVETNQKQMQIWTIQKTPHLLTRGKLLPCPSGSFHLPANTEAILVLMGMDRQRQPGMLGLRTRSRRWFCILSLLSPSWLTLVPLCNIVSSSEFQIELLTRREMAIYVAWSLRLLLQKLYWNSKRPRLVGGQCFVLIFPSFIQKTKHKWKIFVICIFSG